MIIDLNKLIDDRNRHLWETLNEVFNVKLEASLNQEYSCFNMNNDSTIYVVPNNLEPESFTHELLHVYLRLKKVFIGAGFSTMVKNSNTLSKIISEPLLDHIGNCLDHIKMFEIYDDLGFSHDKFIKDFNDNKCTLRELTELKRHYRQRDTYNIQAVDLFIGKFIAIQADFNDDFDYEDCLNEMRRLDPMLYDILEQFIIEWEEFDVDSQDIFQNNYHTILNNLYEELKRWLSKKVFV